jgi:hypothetical protein
MAGIVFQERLCMSTCKDTMNIISIAGVPTGCGCGSAIVIDTAGFILLADIIFQERLCLVTCKDTMNVISLAGVLASCTSGAA